MKNCIIINGQKIELTLELIEKIVAAHRASGVKLSDIPEGETFKIGDYTFVVLHQTTDGTAVILKDCHPEDIKFGSNNNYDGSAVDDCCNKFAESLASLIGEENIVSHEVVLTSDDGLDDYGHVTRKASLLTTELYRRYVRILDKFKPDRWWWLATPWSTETHGNSSAVRCVSPSGYVCNGICSCNYDGVRPFCILKSDIFVSK